MNRSLVLLREGQPARLAKIEPEERKLFGQLGLLSSKPVLYVCNVEEASADKGNEFSERVIARAAEEGAVAVVVSAQIESSRRDARRRAEGLSGSGRPRRAGPQPRHSRRLQSAFIFSARR